MGRFWREALFGVRQFGQSPGLAAATALTIGLGVGANLAIVALVADIFYPATPYADPARLVLLENTGPYFFGGTLREGLTDSRLSLPDLGDLRAGQRSFSALGAFADDHVAVLAGGDRPTSVRRIFVTEGLFDALGTPVLRGRVLAPTDFGAGTPPVALVSDRLWRSSLGSDPGVIGRVIRLDEQPFTIVGVLPSAVFGLLQRRERLLDEGQVDRCVVTPLVAGRAGSPRAS